MTKIKATVEHAGSHEPDGDTFRDDLGKAITEALREQGLKRGDGDYTIVGYAQTSGVETVYDVELDTEERADGKASKPAAKAKPVEPKPVDVVSTDDVTEKL